MNLRWKWLVIPLAGLVSACGLKMPDPVAYTRLCPAIENSSRALAPDALFVAASALRDCRKGLLDYAGYRENIPSFSQAIHNSALLAGDTATTSRQFTEQAWYELLQQRISEPGNRRRLIVFIHGYNTSYNETIEAASQVSRIAGSDIPIVVLRWPSLGKVQGYIYDEDSVNWSQAAMNRTLATLVGMASDVTVIGHSMGSRAAIDAVIHIDRSVPKLAPHIRRVVLASADYDRAIALRAGGSIDQLLATSRKVLAYASREDDPMKYSRIAHGYARLGSSRCKYDLDPALQQLGEEGWCHLTTPRPQLAMVDTTLVASPGMGHSDYLDSCPVRADLALFLQDRAAGDLRQRLSRPDGSEGYQINPAYAAGHSLEIEQTGHCQTDDISLPSAH